jgi:hypothetical protein
LSHQILLADQLSVAFKSGFQSATSERHGLVDFQQKELGSKQAKRVRTKPLLTNRQLQEKVGG